MNLLTIFLKDEQITKVKCVFEEIQLPVNFIAVNNKQQLLNYSESNKADFIFADISLVSEQIGLLDNIAPEENIFYVTDEITDQLRKLIYQDNFNIITFDTLYLLVPSIRKYYSRKPESSKFSTDKDNSIFISLYNILQFTLDSAPNGNIYQKIIEEVSKITVFPYIFLALYINDKNLVFKGVHGLPISPDANHHESIDKDFSGKVIREKRPFVRYNVLETNYDNNVVRELGLNTAVYFPLFSNTDVIGVLAFAHNENYFVTDEQFAWLDTLSKYISSLIEKNQNREKLKEQAELLNKTNEAIIVVNIVDNIVFWNKGAEKLYGFESKTVLDKKINNYFLTSDKVKFLEIEKSVLKNGEWSGELKDITLKGKELILESRWSLIRDENNEPVKILIINTDITEKRKFEKQLLQTQRMESLGTLASGIAHDLNNIFTPILMSIDELNELKPGEKIDFDYVRTIKTCAERGADLIKRILSFTKGNEETLSIIYLSAFVKEFLVIIGKSIPGNISTKISIDNKLTFIFNETHLNQLFLNLCLNARDAMPNGGELLISAQKITFSKNFFNLEQSEFTEYLEITVSDTGTGIPEKLKEKIFDPFFTTKEDGKGTGLGLPTVLSILNSYHGFLNVETNNGKGTNFKIYIPFLTSDLFLEKALK